MKTKLIIIGLLTIFLVGCSREYHLKERGAYIPGNERIFKVMNSVSWTEYNEAEYVEKYNLPVSEQVIYAYDSYRQFWICVKCFLRV